MNASFLGVVWSPLVTESLLHPLMGTASLLRSCSGHISAHRPHHSPRTDWESHLVYSCVCVCVCVCVWHKIYYLKYIFSSINFIHISAPSLPPFISRTFSSTQTVASPVAQMVKNLPIMQETQVQSLGQEWPPTPVFMPGEFHGQRSLVGHSARGLKESAGHNLVTEHA